MSKKESGNIAPSATLALGAGILGSLLTLLVTGKLSMPAIYSSGQGSEQSAVETESTAHKPPVAALSDSSSIEQNGRGTSQMFDSYSEALQQASEERAQFAKTLVELTRQIEELESDAINRRAIDARNTSSSANGESQTAAANAGNGLAELFRGGAPLATVENLVAAGIEYDSALALQDRQSQYQLARLELVDQAEREGWRDSDQFSERLSDLEEQRPDVRSELGDEAYDRFLFEAGRNNRVTIVSIIPGSEAEFAGVQVGDTVFAYADSRVFTSSELQRATREGQRGESVTLQVERQGQSLFIEVARGPLGVSLSPEQRSPL